MRKYRCLGCDYIYDPGIGDPDRGVNPDTNFESLPEGWICPVCDVSKIEFEKIERNRIIFDNFF